LGTNICTGKAFYIHNSSGAHAQVHISARAEGCMRSHEVFQPFDQAKISSPVSETKLQISAQAETLFMKSK